MFDTREYEWADVTVVMAGRDVTGIRGVSYTSSQEKEAQSFEQSNGEQLQNIINENSNTH